MTLDLRYPRVDLGYSRRGGTAQTTASRVGAFEYRCEHLSVAAPVILVQVRCPAGCRLG
jgi:hypothetical protein